MKEVGYGDGYQLAHFYEYRMTTMPTDSINDHIYYEPTEQENEEKIKKRLEYIKKCKSENSTNFEKTRK